MRPVLSYVLLLFSWQCSSLSELLSVFGLGNASVVSLNDLEMMCPAILNQVLLPACPTFPSNLNESASLPDHKGESDYHKPLQFSDRGKILEKVLSNEEICDMRKQTAIISWELHVDFVVFILGLKVYLQYSTFSCLWFETTHFCVILVFNFFVYES